MLEQRLIELRKEFKLGAAQLEAIDQQRAQLRDTLLRISGAIQVVEELLSQQAETLTSIKVPEASLATTR